MSATTTQLLFRGEFCKLHYDTSASGNVSFYINNSKNCRILSCDTLVPNERYLILFYSCTSNTTGCLLPKKKSELDRAPDFSLFHL